MVNVFFSEEGAGIMQIHQKMGSIPSDDEILCLAFMLDHGDISHLATSPERSAYILEMLQQSGSFNDEQAKKDLNASIERYSQDLDRLIDAAKQGKEIRVWNEMSPASVAGFYHLCFLLNPYDVDLHYIEIPRRYHNPRYSSNGVSRSLETSLYDRFDELISNEILLPYFDVNYYSQLWRDLKEENAPLRAIVNGQLISVPESIFDFIILKYLDMARVEVSLIGEILLNDQKRLSDYWLASRIQTLIDKGTILVLNDSDYPYERELIRADI
jgi:hypothetical protein